MYKNLDVCLFEKLRPLHVLKGMYINVVESCFECGNMIPIHLGEGSRLQPIVQNLQQVICFNDAYQHL